MCADDAGDESQGIHLVPAEGFAAMSDSTTGTPSERTPSRRETVLSLEIDRVMDVDVRHPLRADLSYGRLHPLTVTVAFHVEGASPVTWCIGRDLLHQGLSSADGVGDIQVWPARHEGRRAVRLKLASRVTEALFELPLGPLARWLDETYRLVPAGTETEGLDWAAVTAALLRDPEVPSS
jgi:hypothetical protein